MSFFRQRSRDLAAVVFLAACVLVFHWRVLFTSAYQIPWDLRFDHFPMAFQMARALQNGEFPLWDPWTYCGRPVAANIQAQAFYLPKWIALAALRFHPVDVLVDALEWLVAAHIWLGGAFTYWLLKRLGAGLWAALLGALVYSLGGFYAGQAQHLGVVCAAAWMPAAWLAALRLTHDHRPRHIVFAAVPLAMALLAGAPAEAAVVLISTTLLIALRAAIQRRVTPILNLAAAIVLAALLAAIQLIPTWELTQNSVARFRADYLGTGGGLPLEALVSLIIPNFYSIFDLSAYRLPHNFTLLYLYCGLLPLLLVISLLWKPVPYARTFGALLALITLWMLGDKTQLGRWLFAILPNDIRIALHPEFANAAFVLAFAVLAGLALNRIQHAPILAAIVFISAADLTWTGSSRPMNIVELAKDPGVTTQHFDGSREALTRMQQLTRAIPGARIDNIRDSLSWGMSASVISIPNANGADPFSPERIIRARLAFCNGERWGRYYEVSNPHSPVLDLFSIAYLLAREPLPDHALTPNLTRLPDLPGRALYQNNDALPRYRLVHETRSATGLDDAARQLAHPRYDPRTFAIIEGAPAQKQPGTGSVRLLSYRNNSLELEATTTAPAWLVAAETNYPGWTATIDHQPAPVHYADVAFRGVAVPAGTHRIRFTFDPLSLKLGAAFSVVGLLLSAWLWSRA